MAVRRSLLASCLLVTTGAAQTTWIVDASGGGQFRDLPPAIAAAQPGDIVLVRAGAYSQASVNRALRLVGEPGATVPAVSVTGLPAGETCVVRGLASGLFAPPVSVHVRDCLGHVHLEDLTAQGIRVERSRQVSLHGIVANGAPALLVEDGLALVVQCRLTAGVSLLARNHAIVVERSTLTFTHGTATGGLNYSGVGAGSGIELRSGSLVLAGDSATVIAAGDSIVSPNPPAPAILTVGGSITVDPKVHLLPRAGGLPIGGGASVVTRPVPSLQAGVAAQALTVTVVATPGHAVYLFVGTALQPTLDLPFGRLWLDWPHFLVASAVVPASGVHTTKVGLPPFLPGTLVTLQAMAVSGGGVELSAPVEITVDA